MAKIRRTCVFCNGDAQVSTGQDKDRRSRKGDGPNPSKLLSANDNQFALTA